MRAARLSALATLVGLLCVAAPSLGLSSSAPTRARSADDCGRLEFLSGLEAVFGRFKTHAQALTFRSRVTARGFVNANIIEGCNEFDVGVDLQSEARREGFSVTLECIKAKAIGRWDGVLGHGRDRVAANNIVTRAANAGFPGAKLRNDPCGGFEAYVAGFTDQRSAAGWAEEARNRGFPDATAELN